MDDALDTEQSAFNPIKRAVDDNQSFDYIFSIYN